MDKQTKSGMPVDESKYSFTIPRTDEPREKILKLHPVVILIEVTDLLSRERYQEMIKTLCFQFIK